MVRLGRGWGVLTRHVKKPAGRPRAPFANSSIRRCISRINRINRLSSPRIHILLLEVFITATFLSVTCSRG